MTSRIRRESKCLINICRIMKGYMNEIKGCERRNHETEIVRK